MAERILLTGGGTGGHVYPALAIGQALKAKHPDAQLKYAGIKGGIEEEVALKNRIPFLRVISAPYPGASRVYPLLRFVVRLGVGTLMGIFHLLRFRPSVIVATGGYVAAPAVFASVILRNLRLLKVKIFVHEQNIRPGKLNTLVARFADLVGVSFPESGRYLKGARLLHCGYPVRPALRVTPISRQAGTGAKDEAALEQPAPLPLLSGIPDNKQVVLVFGGSQGARTINRAIIDALPGLKNRDDLFIIHGRGRKTPTGGYDPAQDCQARLDALEAAGQLPPNLDSFYRQVDYIDDMNTVYRRAALVVARGGAGTIKELCAVRKPAVLLPKAGLSGDHQVLNAMAFAEAGAGMVLLEEPVISPEGLIHGVSGSKLAVAVNELLDDPDRQATMAKAAATMDDLDSTTRIVDALFGPAQSSTDAPTGGKSQGKNLAQPGTEENGNNNCVQKKPWFKFLPATQPKDIKKTQPPEQEMATDSLAELGPSELLNQVRSWKNTPSIRLDESLPCWDYLRYRTASLLAVDNWTVRNTGIKLAGLLQIGDLVPLLKHLFLDPTPARLTARLAGGDRKQNGFIRRNIVIAITQMGMGDCPDTAHILREALTDNYFETRTAACNAIFSLGPPICHEQWAREGTRKLLNDRSFEVRIAAITAQAKTTVPARGLPDLRKFYMDPNWKIRQAVLKVFEHWANHSDRQTKNTLLKEMKNFLLTAGGYRPVFGLKETASSVISILTTTDCKEEPAQATGEGREEAGLKAPTHICAQPECPSGEGEHPQ